jgi:hypothetical protein
MNAHLRAPRFEPASRTLLHNTSSFEASRRRPWLTTWCLAPVSAALAVMIACSTGGQQPTGPAADYSRAKTEFAKGTNDGYDRALDTLEGLANADPANDFTERARVLRLVIFSGEVEGYKTLADAYGKGADTSKVAAIKSEYGGLQRDVVRRGAELTLRLGEVAMQLTKGGSVPSGLTLDAPYPSVEAPTTIPALDTVRAGLKIGHDDEAQAELVAARMGVADALAAIVNGDRSKAKSEMNAGPVTLDSTEFCFFVADQVMAGATFYDSKHLIDPTHYKLLAGIAQDALKPVQLALKQKPDADRAKRAKKLQDQINSGIKAFPSYIG